MPTLADVDEAIYHARSVPVSQRGAAWHAYMGGLLAQRDALDNDPATPVFSGAATFNPPKTTRVLGSDETR